MMRIILPLALVLMTASPMVASMAATDPVPPEQAEKVLKAENPYFEKMKEKNEELANKLGEAELKHLYFIREGFGITRAVTMVRRDVGNAVKACGKDNPEMKPDMDGRFDEWTKAVDPAIADKEAAIETAIKGQNYAKPKEIKDYLKLIEQTAEYANKNIDKQIVTTKDACESLLKSMDKTQKVVSELVAGIELKPWPPIAGEDDVKPETTPAPKKD